MSFNGCAEAEVANVAPGADCVYLAWLEGGEELDGLGCRGETCRR